MSGGGKGGSQVVGYRYYFGILMGLCRGPVNGVREIKIGDRRAWIGDVTTSASIAIDAYDLFGGEKGEGGVQGTLELKMGEPTQTMVGSMYEAMRPGDLPGMRGVVTAFFDGIICMLNPYPKPWKWRMWRTTAGWDNATPWYPSKATILMPVETTADFSHLHAMNPAHIIYECTTNRQWGRGKDASAIDEASFRQCADQLFDEGFGLCLRWTRKDSVSAFIALIINHIGAAVFTSRKTGLITMRLIRGGYDIDDLPFFDTESGLLSIDASEVSSGANAINMVEVKYRDQVSNEDATVKIGNLAALQSANGIVNSKSIEYPGVPVSSLAMRLAQRDLRAESSSIRRFTLTFDRRGYAIEPGSVVVIEDIKRNIKRTAVRVGNVDVSNYREGKIKVVAVQDVFSLPSTTYAAAVPPSWVAPVSKPCISDQKVFEMPYFMIARSLSAADLAYITDDTGYLATMSAQGQPMNLGYRIAVRDSAPTAEDTPTTAEYYCSI